MEGPEFVLAIVAMAMGTGIIITVITKGVDLIKSWINRNNPSYDAEKFERLAKSFIHHRKDTDRRLQNIEAIITEDEPGSISSHRQAMDKSESHTAIEMHANDDELHETDSGNLSNMLNQKRTR